MNEVASSIILFDGVCNFCNSSVNFIIKHDKKNSFHFAQLQSKVGEQLLSRFNEKKSDPDTIILIENGKLYKRSDAILRISKNLNGLYFLFYGLLIIPRSLRDGVYNYIANNRYKWFGKKDICLIPKPELRSKFIS
jgi:predicted DCC family thiol-disulfide oxidoreductase YuxK